MSDFSSDAEENTAEQLAQLKEENDLLTKKNTSLESQIERMLDICNSVESVTQENTQNKAKIKDLMMKNEELQGRLDYNLKQNKELLEQLENQKKYHEKSRNEEADSLNNEFEKLADEYRKKIDNLNNELQNARNQQNNDMINKKIFNSKIDKLLQAAQWHFGEEVASIENLTKLLQTVNNKVPEVQVVEPQDDENIQILVEQCKKYKSKAKQAIKQLALLSNELDDKDQEINNLNEKIQRQANEQLAELTQVREENSLLIQNLQKKISNLESRLTQEKSEFTKFKQESRMNILNLTSQRIQLADDNVKDNKNDSKRAAALSIELSGIKQQLMEKSQTLAKVTEAKDDAINKVTNLMEQNNKLTSEIEKLKLEVDNYRIISEEAKKETESIRSSLHAKQQSPEPAVPEKKEVLEPKPSKKETVSKRQFECVCNKLKDAESRITNLNKEVIDLEDENLKNRVTISSLQDQLKNAEKRTMDAKLDLQEAEDKLNKASQKKPEEELVWSFPDLDATLQSNIEKIGRQKELQNQSKLQNAFKEVCKYIKSKELALLDKQRNTETMFNNLRDFANTFVIDTTLLVNGHPTILEDFVVGGMKDAFINNLHKLVDDNENLRREGLRVAEQIASIKKQLDLPISSPIESITKAINEVFTQNEQYKALASKSMQEKRTMKKAMTKAMIEANELKRQSENAIKDVQLFSDDNSKKIDLLERTVSTLKEKLANAESQLDKVSSELEITKEKNEKLQEDYDFVICDTDMKVEEKCGDKIREMQKKVNESEAEVKSMKIQLETATKLRESAESEFKRLQNEVELTKRKLVDAAQSHEENMKKQREDLMSVNKKSLDEMQKQLERSQSDISKLCKENSSLEERNKVDKQKLVQIQNEVRRLEKELQQMEEVISREKKLLDVTARTKIAQAEASVNERVDRLKSDFLEEKMKIMHYAAESFPQFFSASQTFDDRQYRTLLKQASDELQRLTESDSTIRSLVCALESQSTIDAVAQTLM